MLTTNGALLELDKPDIQGFLPLLVHVLTIYDPTLYRLFATFISFPRTRVKISFDTNRSDTTRLLLECFRLLGQ